MSEVIITSKDCPAAPPKLTADEKRDLNQVADQAARLYPGPVGEVLYREIHAWRELGYRFAADRLIPLLVTYVKHESGRRRRLANQRPGCVCSCTCGRS